MSSNGLQTLVTTLLSYLYTISNFLPFLKIEDCSYLILLFFSVGRKLVKIPVNIDIGELLIGLS